MLNGQVLLSAISRLSNSYIFLAIISIIIGIFIFNLFIKIPDVGVITIDSPIMDEETKDEIVKMLRYARDDNSIKAVVSDIRTTISATYLPSNVLISSLNPF